MRLIVLFILAFATWVVSLAHVTTLPPPTVSDHQTPTDVPTSFFIPKQDMGIHQLVLFGTAYQRGKAEGALTEDIMQAEEAVLFAEFERFFPNPFLRTGFVIGAMRYFWGAEQYISVREREYFYGQSSAASARFNHYIDPYTRQAALHGIHEVGQMFVDVRREDMGCTAVALPFHGSWIIGRNFDFEVDRMFDEGKALKWHIPHEGNRFVSVNWPGFLGTVSGVNEHGLYISLNAAGSSDYRRYGQITTLLATDILQSARTAKEAVARLETADTFITDIFLVVDKHEAYRVEKSPRRTRVMSINTPHAIANHLVHPDFQDDAINTWRQKNLSTVFRAERANELLEKVNMTQFQADSTPELTVLRILRDKNGKHGQPLHPGNRRAIDALIASHSVIYDAARQVLYVSEGPALTGRFHGFDLKESFQHATPVRTNTLPADPDLGPSTFAAIKSALKLVAEAESLIADNQCLLAREQLDKARILESKHNYYHRVYGRYYACLDDLNAAKMHWRQAMQLQPAYEQDRAFLRRHL